MTETIWPAEPQLFSFWPFKRSLLLPGVGIGMGRGDHPCKGGGCWDLRREWSEADVPQRASR